MKRFAIPALSLKSRTVLEQPQDVPPKEQTTASEASLSDQTVASDDESAIVVQTETGTVINQDIERQRQQIDLQEYKREIDFQRRLRLIQLFLGNSVGLVILSTGIFFTSRDNLIGPYMMGVGAAAAGFSIKETAETVSALSGK